MREQTVRLIEIGLIEPDPNNRQQSSQEEIPELAASIRQHELQQPIIVRPLPRRVGEKSRYVIIAGERRWRAHKHLGLDHIRALVAADLTDDEVALRRIIENLQRKDLRPMEEARGFQLMLDRGMSQEQLAKEIGLRSQPWRVSYRVRLLNLRPEAKKLLEDNQISLNAAQEIAKLAPADQTRVVRQLASGTLKGDVAVAAAVKAIEDKLSQEDIFGERADGGRIVAAKDVEVVGRMEARIEQVARMVASGWHENDCTVARKVSADRAALMADRIGVIRTGLARMEKELRAAAAQAALVLDVG